ncbi:MAG: hypothetical protein Unbinned8596contig1000_16 [Prokaryotic dsDNA virus sp.]|nr:MAG: hypothetical protein Unbinned8596contig1000_16 [Prokaryotic dsDNA virus sp.]
MGKKTVVDAVNALGANILTLKDWNHILFLKHVGAFHISAGNPNIINKNDTEFVCHRCEFEMYVDSLQNGKKTVVDVIAQYEAYLSEQSGDEWTHIDEQGFICRIVHTIDNKAWVRYKCDDYFDDVVDLSDLKPYEPEWTYIDENDEPCKVVSDTPDAKGWIVILKKRTGMYKICPKGHVQQCR